MTTNQISTITSGNQLTDSQRAIVSVTNALKADFPLLFAKAFKNNGDLKNYRMQLHKDLKNIRPNLIIQAYDVALESSTDFMPSSVLIKKEAKHLQFEYEKGLAEEAKIKAAIDSPPKNTIQCDPISLLKEAGEKAKGIFKGKNKADDKKAWLERKEAALLANNANTAGVGRRYASNLHLCSFDSCNRSGAITSSTTGSERFFCAQHFRMAH